MTPIYSAAFHEVAASTPPRWERQRRRQPIRTTLWLGQTPWNSGEETAHNVCVHLRPRTGAGGHHMIGVLDEALICIPGVPESQLPQSTPLRTSWVALRGPRGTAKSARCSGSAKARPSGAAEALPEVLRGLPRVPVTVGALIQYLDSPVGSYAEVVAAPVLVRRPFPQANVAFIAVDSGASVVGGRSNWALPKVLARFDGDIGSAGQATSTGPDWAVQVVTRPRALRLPTWLRYSCCQVWPGPTLRHFPLEVQGWSRPATVDVEVSSSGSLGSWLAPGRHLGFTVCGTPAESVPPGR